MKGFAPFRTGLGALAWTLLVTATAASLAAEWALPESGHSGGSGVFGRKALIGFLSGIAAVLLARLVARVLTRGEEYYDD